MHYIHVQTNLDLNNVTNVRAYAVCFASDPGIEIAADIQSFVYSRRGTDAAKYSVVEMVNTSGNLYECTLLQKYDELGTGALLNIVDDNQTTYIVTIADDGSTALNGTMKTCVVVA
jgi:hypothetical protein